MSYKYVRPGWCKAKSERDREISFLLNGLYNIKKKKGKISLLDVGFAGCGYIEKILELGNVRYTGLDSDGDRIRGDTLQMVDKPKFGYYSKEEWRRVLAKINFIEADIVGYTTNVLYDVVILISAIEHIVPLGYANVHKFDFYVDIKAVDFIKSIVKEGGYLLLTFPCGEERKFVSVSNPKKSELLKESGFIESRQNILIYDEKRMDSIVGDWGVIKEQYWVDTGNGHESCSKLEAFGFKHKDSKPSALCALLLKNNREV